MMEFTFRPLSAWPGTPTKSFSRRSGRFNVSISKTWQLLQRELSHLRAKNVTIEADCEASEIRNDGKLRANAKLRGPGIVLSFDSKNGPLRFPCDTFTQWDNNLRAIALSLEALRTVDRYGVTQKAEQYTGWNALPDKTTEAKNVRKTAAEWMVQRCFAEYLRPPSVEQLLTSEGVRREFYKLLAVRLHPDRKGGDESQFKELQKYMAAFEEKGGSEACR